MGFLRIGVTLGINCVFSICAYFTTKYSIQNLGDMFIAANLSGMDLCKKSRPKMWVSCIPPRPTFISCSSLFFHIQFVLSSRPEAMGAVTGCILLVTLFLFIPVPFIPVPLTWNLIADNISNQFLTNQVSPNDPSKNYLYQMKLPSKWLDSNVIR